MRAEKLDNYNVPSLPTSDEDVESDFRGYTDDLDATMAMSTMSDIVLPPSVNKAEAEEEERKQLKRDKLLAMQHDKIYERKKKILNAISKEQDKIMAKKAVMKTAKKKAKMILGTMKKEEKEPKPEKREERQVR